MKIKLTKNALMSHRLTRATGLFEFNLLYNKNLEVNSMDSPVSVDYPKNENAVVNFEN